MEAVDKLSYYTRNLDLQLAAETAIFNKTN